MRKIAERLVNRLIRALDRFGRTEQYHFCRQLEGRTKALKQLGKLAWETKQPDEFEWLSVYFTPSIGNDCIFQFAEENRANIYVRSSKRKDRGRVLLRAENLFLFDNAEAIVNAIETTVIRSYGLITEERIEEATIHAAWSVAEIRVNGLAKGATQD